jgi:type 1 fimbriae regulatory protein FimB
MKSLTRAELDGLLAEARKVSELDYLLFLTTFNHGLRASETTNLDRSNIQGNYLVVQRLKGSEKTTQPLMDDERAAILALASSDKKFFPISKRTFERKMRRYGKAAGIPEVKCHPHALKHSCGRLAYLGGMGIPEMQCWLGHKSGSNTLKYMAASEEEAALAFAAAVGK